MRHPMMVLLAMAAAAAGPAAAGQPGFTKGVANAALIAAARSAPLKAIDYDEELCRNDRTVQAWLTELVGDAAASIDWSAGPCQLVTDLNPLDSGSAWCAQAFIRLKHPKSRNDQPMIEVFFDEPTHGRPGPAYAFRADIDDSGLIRFRRDFENAWLERFPATADRIRCPEE